MMASQSVHQQIVSQDPTNLTSSVHLVLCGSLILCR